ncbi:MAG: ABC transporter substrate-binding protein [Promethearchaeota archaeon]
MKRRLIIICCIMLLTIQIIPINSSINKILESDSEKKISQGVETSANLVPPQVLRYISPYTSIEYDMIANYSYIATLIFDPLVEYSFETGELIPALAKQWVVTNDSKHWIFTLRDDVKFHDGTTFNASAVKFTYDRFIDPAHPAYVANPISELGEMPLESVEILDEYRVSINFNQSYAPFIYQEAAYCGIYSPNSFGGGPNVINPIGTGPYYLDEIASNSTFQKFIRNNQYFRGVPPFEEIQFFTYSSWGDFQAAVEAHNGDFATIGVSSLPENDPYWEETLGPDGLQFGYFNHLRPNVNDSNVRLAINYAFNNQIYVDQQVLPGISKGVKPLRSVIYSGDPYHDESIQGYPYNIELANSILDSAGYPKLGNGYRFDIELVGWNYAALETIKDDLELIGINCTIVYGSIPELLPDLYAGNFDLFYYSWAVIMDPSITRKILHSSGDLNFGGYSNSEIDLYTTLGQQTPVRQEREYYYFQVQRVAQEDAPLLLIQEYEKIYLRSYNVTPFIQMSKNTRIIFNYSTQKQNNDIYIMEEIEVSSDPIYFPFTDGVVTLESEQITSNMAMTHELSNLIPDQQETGKFYELQVNNSDIEYQIRCYYDLDEISNLHEKQEVFQWDYSTQTWNKLEVVASNTNLRFSEIQLKGNAILRLGQIDLFLLTFRYLPIILIIIGPIIVLTSIILIKNRNVMKKIKEEYNLS